jgi:hypothetical protein
LRLIKPRWLAGVCVCLGGEEDATRPPPSSPMYHDPLWGNTVHSFFSWIIIITNSLLVISFYITAVGLYTHTRARSIFFSYPFSNFPAYIHTHTRPTFLCVAIIRCCYTIALAGWPLLSSAPSSSPSFCLPYKYRINTSDRRLSTHTSDAQPHAFRFIYIIMGYKHQSGLYMSLRFPV